MTDRLAASALAICKTFRWSLDDVMDLTLAQFGVVSRAIARWNEEMKRETKQKSSGSSGRTIPAAQYAQQLEMRLKAAGAAAKE